MVNDDVVARVKEITERVGGSEGIELFDVKLLGGGKRRVLRIVIDKAGGVTHADCELISQQVGTILDVEDVVPGGSYTLEVSSPGVERPLREAQDYERYAGRKARVSLREPVENRRQWEGILAGVSGGMVTLELAPGKSIQFALDQVSKANLKFDW
jgi:ribosome maturation factor RimP